MDNIANVYDLLNQDAEFARQVGDIHRSASEVLTASGELNKRMEAQGALFDDMQRKADELTGLLERLDGRLMDMRQERDALEATIRRQEDVLAEMQRLEESFNGALTAYGNIVNVYRIFEDRVKELEGRIGAGTDVPPSRKAAPEVTVAPAAPVKAFVPFENVDYDEVTSVEKLFKKYNGKIEGPVIVVRTKTFPWNGDYCMAVRSVGKGKAWGVRYAYGEPGKKTPLSATDEEYSMYKGENYWRIAEDFGKQG